MRYALLTLALAAFTFSATTAEAVPQELPSDLTRVGLDQLLNFDLNVSLPGKKLEKAADVPSAVYVLTHDDIAKSGVTHVAEALRLVPGVSVARVASNKWAISVRGFNQVFANKLLVLIDGVSVFSPTTNGVYWETNELVLEDIDRIEVVRGPGAALWGANAVNGVINIITKRAKQTQGGYLMAGGGTHDRVFGDARWGGELGATGNYRAYITAHNRESNRFVGGGDSNDDWESYSGGFRYDVAADEKQSLTVLGDLGMQSDILQPTTPTLTPPFVDPTTFRRDRDWHSARAAVNWSYGESEETKTETQLSYVRKQQDTELVSFYYDSYNFDLQQRFSPWENHDFVTGVGYRYFRNNSDGSYAHEVNPSLRETNLLNFFAQDDITIVPDRVHVVVGSKYEHDELTGSEVMPNLKGLYTPSKKTTFWASVARAAASPAIFFEDTTIPLATIPSTDGVPSILLEQTGSEQISPEVLWAYEVGARTEISENLFADVAVFYNEYSDIFSLEPGAPSIGTAVGTNSPVLIAPLAFANEIEAESAGVEVALGWKPTDWWNLKWAYSFITLRVRPNSRSISFDEDLITAGTPKNQLSLQSFTQLAENWGLSTILRYVGAVETGGIDEYADMDLSLTYQVAKGVDVSIVGQNLLHDSHQEFVGNLFGPPPTEIERAVYGKVSFSF